MNTRIVDPCAISHMVTPPWPDLPGRIFLDTCTLNLILDNQEAIFDGECPLANLSTHSRADVMSLRGLFQTGQRASWQLAISPNSFTEILATRNRDRRDSLNCWFFEVWHSWREIVRQCSSLPTGLELEELRVQVLSSETLSNVPDLADRVLLSDAIAYRCDCFCTRDWNSLLRVRTQMHELPLKLLSPSEWWSAVKPYAALW
jgi:hypothetical protein